MTGPGDPAPPSKILRVPFAYPVSAIRVQNRTPELGRRFGTTFVKVPCLRSSEATTVGTARIHLPVTTDVRLEETWDENGRRTGRTMFAMRFDYEKSSLIDLRYRQIDGVLYRPVIADVDLAGRFGGYIQNIEDLPRFQEICDTKLITTETVDIVMARLETSLDGAFEGAFYRHNHAAMLVPFGRLRNPRHRSMFRQRREDMRNHEIYHRTVGDMEAAFHRLAVETASTYRFVDGILHVPTTGPGRALQKDARGRMHYVLRPDISDGRTYRVDVPDSQVIELERGILNECEVRDGALEALERHVVPWSGSMALPGNPLLETMREVAHRLYLARDEGRKRNAGPLNILSADGLEAFSALGHLTMAEDASIERFSDAFPVLSEALDDVVQNIDFLAPEWTLVMREAVSELAQKMIELVEHGHRMATFAAELDLDDKISDQLRL
jgi:hypothetical protein